MGMNTANSDKMQKLLQKQQKIEVDSVCNLKERLKIGHKTYIHEQDSNTTTDDTCSLTVSRDFSIDSIDTYDFDIKKSVRFSESNNIVKIIENRHDMSNKEKRNYWYGDHELDAMRPSLHYLNRAHQNCGKKNGCIRGLETQYWTMKMVQDSDYTHLQTFVPPPKSFLFDDNNNLNIEQPQYRNYVIQIQQKARIMALMDERYVMEHVYGLPCSHTIGVLQSDKWECLRCCSCHSAEISSSSSTRQASSSSFGKLMKGMRKRITMKN